MSLSASQQSFVDSINPYAQSVGQQTGIDPNIIIAQSALETGWGSSVPNNNYFGIKGNGASLSTIEYIGGEPVTVSQGFAGYSGIAQSFAGYANLMSGSRYSDVRNATTVAGQIAALGASGYATDPNYASKISSIVGKLTGSSIGSAISTALKLNPVTAPFAIGADALGLTDSCGWVCQIKNWLNSTDFFKRVAFVILGMVLIVGAIVFFAKGEANQVLSKVVK